MLHNPPNQPEKYSKFLREGWYLHLKKVDDSIFGHLSHCYRQDILCTYRRFTEVHIHNTVN